MRGSSLIIILAVADCFCGGSSLEQRLMVQLRVKDRVGGDGESIWGAKIFTTLRFGENCRELPRFGENWRDADLGKSRIHLGKSRHDLAKSRHPEGPDHAFQSRAEAIRHE